MFKPYRTVLPNGLRIITVPMKDTPTVTVMVLVETGTLYETKKINGISHFLEHMCFKGTPTRPSALSIAHELDSLGADVNAFTDYEYTGYYAKARVKHFAHILNIVSDVYLNPLLPKEEVEKEKGVVIEEINMYEDLPQKSVHDLFNTLLHGNQPAGWNILGTKQTVTQLTQDNLRLYRNEYYTATRTTVLIAGGIKPTEILPSIKKTFQDIPKNSQKKRVKTKEKQNNPQIISKYKKTDQTHFVLGFRSFNAYDTHRYALRLLGTILGQGMSSRLWQKLREEMGVCYYVGSHNETSLDTGVFKIISGVDTKRLEEVLKVIMSEITHLKKESVPDEELQKAKEFIIGGIEMGLESSSDVANFYGIQEIFHRKLQMPEEHIRKIKKVTARDIQKAAQAIFKANRLNLAMVGPLKSTHKIKKVLKI